MPATARQAPPEIEQLRLLEPPPEAAEPAAAKPLAAACRDAARGRRYKRGFDPSPMLLLAQSYDDFIAADSPVRAIADYVDALVDLAALGFKHATGGPGPGQPPFHPGDLLKLLIYGYLNGVRSSRRLARECRINVELIWLLGGLQPGYHSIADCRKDNIDAAQLEALKARAAQTQALIEDLEERGETQHSRTDPDARRLRKHGKSLVGYNVQTAVDGAHKLIIAHALTNAGNDEGQLVPMIERTCDTLGIVAAQPPAASAEDAHSEAAGSAQAPVQVAATATLAHSSADPAPAANADAPAAPAPERTAPVILADAGYFTGADIAACPLRAQCLPTKTPVRQVYRSEHTESTERLRQRMDTPEAKARIRRRSGLCEHPFGTIKRSLGWDHFLLRGFHKAGGELSLIVQMYNFRRVLNILGVDGFRAFCAQRRRQAAAEKGANSLRVLPALIRPLQTLWATVCAFASRTPLRNPLPRAPLGGAPAAH